MKYNKILYTGSLLLISASCHRNNYDVVSESYVHRYGVELPAQDWAARGQSGQVVTVTKDGITQTKSYDSGILHGECTATFPHREVVQTRDYYEQGTLTKQVENYSNGSPMRQTMHSDESQQQVTSWYENGTPKSVEEYNNGLLHRAEYYTYNQDKEAAVDDFNGVRINRDPYGQMICRDDIREGQLHRRTNYHPNGTPQSVASYMNGAVQGQRYTYHPTGEPNTIEEYVGGVQEGNTQVFMSGEKYSDVPYKNGQKNGVERRYRDGEVLVEEVSWAQDMQHGPTHSYVGSQQNTDWYFQGAKVSKVAFDALKNQ